MTLIFDGSFQPSDHWVDKNHFSSQKWGTDYNACFWRSDSIAIIPAPGGRPGYAARLNARTGDICDTAQVRAMIAHNFDSNAGYKEGNEMWFSFSIYLDSNFTSNANVWGTMVEERFDTIWMPSKNPDAVYFVKKLGKIQARLGAVNGINQDIYVPLFGNVNAGWHDILIHQKWSKSAIGFVEYFYNGVSVGRINNRVTLPPDSTGILHWPLGIYEGTPQPQDTVVTIYNIKAGTTRADVEYNEIITSLLNSNFEQDPIATGTYYNYSNPATGETGTAIFTWATDQSHSPTHSLKIESTYTNIVSFARWLSNNSSIPAVAGMTYNASCYIKTTNAYRAMFRLTYWNGIPGIGGLFIGETRSPIVTDTQTTFVQVVLSDIAPSTTTHIRIEFVLNGSGTVYFDDVTLDETTPITKTITVTAPNGGETWESNEIHNINWISTGIINNVKIELFDNNLFVYTIVANTVNTGSYSWTVPKTVPSSSVLTIKISDVTDASISDISNISFTIIIPTITITSPISGDHLKAGSSNTITWTNTGTINNVKIDLIKGSTPTTIISSTPNTGSYPLNIPMNQLLGNDYIIQISDTSDITRTANVGITIDPSDITTITLNTPNGGETWQSGYSQTITWTSTGDPGNVKIELLKGILPTTITLNFPNTGSYTWLIPNNQIPSDDYRIRISSIYNFIIGDISDNIFYIENPCPTPLTDYTYVVNNLHVDFADMSTNIPISWNWDFGDSTTSNLQNPSHDYITEGQYTIKLISSNLCGDGNEQLKVINVIKQISKDNTFAYTTLGLSILYFIIKTRK